MAYVRRRSTKSGGVSTALVESYRNDQGRPRQRLLANLCGEPDPLKALAKLAAQREALRKEKKQLAEAVAFAQQFHEAITQNVLGGRQYTAAERRNVDKMLKRREYLLKRLAKVADVLEVIEKNGAIIKKHCTATPDEIQAAIRAYKQEFKDAEALVLGMEFSVLTQMKEAKAKLRRLSPWVERTTVKDILAASEPEPGD
jgi:hypothetical protein